MSDKRVLFTLTHGPEKCDLSRHTAIAGRAGGAGAVITGDGAYLATGGHLAPLVDAGVELFALRDSVEARGLIDLVDPAVELIDYHRWVDLIMGEYDLVL